MRAYNNWHLSICSCFTRRPAGGMIGPMASEQKITLREMREMRVCGLLIYS
jgi:hypothetical protein